MNFSSYSIKNPIPAVLLFVLLTVAGLLSFNMLKVQDFPDIELPSTSVVVVLPGAAPEQLETEVARPIEDAIANLQMLKNTYTTISSGVVSIVVEFELEKDSFEAVNEVRDAISNIRSTLPNQIEEPVVSKLGVSGQTIVAYAVEPKAMSSGTDQRLDPVVSEQISWLIDNSIKKKLLGLEGVGSVKRIGGDNREILIELDSSAIDSFGVTALDVSRLLRQTQIEQPGGIAEIGGSEQSIRTISTLRNSDELGDLALAAGGGRQIKLKNVATIEDTIARKQSLALFNGKEVVAFEVLRTKGASETAVAEVVRTAIDELNAELTRYEIVNDIDNALPVEKDFESSMQLLYEGALLAILVVWLFLKDWRAMLVAATALPLSIIPTFLGLYLFGYTLNVVTLLAMALVVGVLVDDAIVEIENIERHMAMGKSAYQASMEAADEIGMAVIATTATLVAVFLPTAFMSGIPGLFFKQFGWTAVIAIVSSLLVARLLTPMMSAYFLKPKAKQSAPKKDSRVMKWYLSSVKSCLRHPWLVLIASTAFFVGSIWLSTLLPTGFVPAGDRSQTVVNVELPPESTLEDTTRVAEQARQLIEQVDNVTSVFSSVGGGSSGSVFAPGSKPAVNTAVLTVNMTPREDRTGGLFGLGEPAVKLADVEKDIRLAIKDLPGARFTVNIPGTGGKLQLVLESDDATLLKNTADQVITELRTLQGIGNVSSSSAMSSTEVIVRPDSVRAANAGVTTSAIAESMRVATTGDYDVSLAKLNVDERQIPIRVRFPEDQRNNLDDLRSIQVPTQNGALVKLGSVADLSINSGPSQIQRLNRSRDIVIDVELAQSTLGDVSAAAYQLPTLSNLPNGVRTVELGDAAEMKKLFGSFIIAMGIGVFCIYAVLVLLFKDFFQPVTVLGALPLSVGGAMVALLITGQSLSMPSMIGLIMLMGIVTKNSILLIDYAIIARENGESRFEALVDACHKRARPIIMTTIAMGAGMMPLALGLNGDPSFRAPMAICVIGGLITSTLLSLIVVPALYVLMDQFENWVFKLFKRSDSKA